MILLIAVVVTAISAWAVKKKNGRFSSVADADRLGVDEIGIDLGERATLVQFSSAFCAPCRATRVLLTDIADKVDGVVTVDIDAEEHLDLVRQLNILRTPTVLVLDSKGAIVTRASGLPRREQVLSALGDAVGGRR
ncbi:MAG: thioredoxin [Aeromicrobium sp.]|nr:thioredoxin [Aeromicrobium sp.]